MTPTKGPSWLTYLKSLFSAPEIKNPVPLGGVRPLEYLYLGAVIVGEKKAGKTSLAMRCVNTLVRLNRPLYGVCTGDALVDRIRHVAPAGYEVRRWNPTVVGGRAIDFAAVTDTEINILNLASKLIPVNPGERDEFWTSGSRSICVAGIRALNHFDPKRRWRLSDLLWITTRAKLFAAVLKATNDNVFNPVGEMTKRSVAASDLFATVRARLLPLEVYANLSDHAELDHPLAPLRGGGAVVMEWSDNFKEAMERCYAFVFDLVADEVLSRYGDEDVVLWTDELASLQKMEFIGKVARRGRRSKVAFLWTLHTIEGLFARYGKDVAMDILDGMGVRIFLRTAGVATSKWSADVMGKRLIYEHVWQQGQGLQGGRWSTQVVERFNVHPSLFADLPFPDPNQNLLIRGYCRGPGHKGPFKAYCLEDNTFVRNRLPVPRTSASKGRAAIK